MNAVIRNEKFTGNETFKRGFNDSIVVDCHFEDYDSEGADLINSVFVGCRFTSVDFYWAKTFGSKFIKCAFEDVDFRGAAMADTSFIECVLQRCDFRRDNLGAYTDLSQVSFIDTQKIDCRHERIEMA